jgi:hypothetical protein
MRLSAPDNAIALAISARILTGTACRIVILFDDTGCSDASNVSNMPLVCFAEVAEKQLKNQASYRPSAGITRIRFKGSMASEAILSAGFIPAPR